MNDWSKPFRIGRVWTVLMLLCGLDAQAALTVIGTRFVYPAETASLPIRVGNNAEQPILLQAWLDNGEATTAPSELQVPFVLFPPIVRLEPQQRAALELRYTHEPLPRDRESVFWINLLEVPAQSADSQHLLQLSYRMRMKVLFRPEGLPGGADQAARQLTWGFEPLPQRRLKIGNRSAYYVSVPHLTLGEGSQAVHLQGITIEPYGTTRVALPDAQSHIASGTPIRYDVVDDNGAIFSASAWIEN